MILYVNGFGRFPAVTTRYHDGAIGLRFDMTEHKRARLTTQIKAFLKAGIVGVTNLRRYKRVPVPAEGSFVRANGDQVSLRHPRFLAPGRLRPDHMSARWSAKSLRWAITRAASCAMDEDGIAIQFLTTRGRASADESLTWVPTAHSAAWPRFRQPRPAAC